LNKVKIIFFFYLPFSRSEKFVGDFGSFKVFELDFTIPMLELVVNSKFELGFEPVVVEPLLLVLPPAFRLLELSSLEAATVL
jgi:hypothetical protein